MSDSYIQSNLKKLDENFELPLRPQSLSDFLGQESIRERLSIYLGAAKIRQEALGHALFHGPPGLGKTTLANILAKNMGVNLVVTSGPMIEKAGDLAGILTNLKEKDILFIDEIHRLNKTVEEYLYPAMEDFVLDLMIDSGPSARSVQVKLNKFTLVGATTSIGLISAPMRSRFHLNCRLDYYDHNTLELILIRSSKILGLSIDQSAAQEIARRSRGTPRIANNLLKWIRDYAQMKNHQLVNEKIASEALEMLLIDHKGLDEMDIKILEIIIEHYNGGPVGLNTLAVALGENPMTVSEVYEPYLIMQGFLKRTPRGREATQLAYKHIGRPTGQKNGDK
ncbi:MAG: Holliday junction branch migration DNA helicase RuvB [Rhabdochlamydiaceae bacterium]